MRHCVTIPLHVFDGEKNLLASAQHARAHLHTSKRRPFAQVRCLEEFIHPSIDFQLMLSSVPMHLSPSAAVAVIGFKSVFV